VPAWTIPYPTATSTSNTDPYFSNVSLLLHCDGANGSTTIIDSSSYAHLVGSSTGTPEISTAQSVYGGASLRMSGSGIKYSNVTELDVSSGDFTIEFRVRTDSLSNNEQYIGWVETNNIVTGWKIRKAATTGIVTFYAGDSNTSAYEVTISSTTAMSANTWHAIAVTRSGDTFNLYFDATREGTGTWSGTIANQTGPFLQIGRTDGTAGFNMAGYLDEIRLTKGVARYTGASYTLATAAFPDS